MSAPDPDWMLIGRIVGAFGIRGEMKVEPFTDFPKRFSDLRQVWLGPSHDLTTVERARSHKALVLLKLVGCDSPEAAKTLKGVELRIPRSQAMELPSGHYYLDEVVGMRVFNRAGEQLGDVTEAIRTGSNDVFVVGEGSRALLIPMIKDAVVDLDLEGRRVVVEEWVLESDGS